jgi:ABC-type uncharacterized transport system permease subunit
MIGFSVSWIKRLAFGILCGGSVGFLYQWLVGCRTGACPLTATPLRAVLYGAVVGLLFALSRYPKKAASISK